MFLGFLAPLLMVALWTAGFVTVLGESEDGAWELMSATIIAGIAGALPAWGRAGRPLPGLALFGAKLAMLLFWAWGWWSPFEESIRQVLGELDGYATALFFFWYAPPFFAAIAIGESVLLFILLRQRSPAKHAIPAPSSRS